MKSIKNNTNTTIEKTSSLKSFTALSRKQLQTVLGGEEPTISRGTKTSIGT